MVALPQPTSLISGSTRRMILEASRAFLKGDKYEGAIDENVFTKKIKQSFKIKDKNVTLNLYVHVFYDQEVAAIATKRIQQRREEVIKLIKSNVTTSEKMIHMHQ